MPPAVVPTPSEKHSTRYDRYDALLGLGVFLAIGALVFAVGVGVLLASHFARLQRRKGRTCSDVFCLLLVGPCRRNIDPAFSFYPSNEATDVILER